MKALVCLFSAVFSVASVVADEKPVAEQETEPKVFTCRDGSVFRYRWHVPAKTEPGKRYPLVIVMHGSGECGTNNVAQLKWGSNELLKWGKARQQEFYLLVGQAPFGDTWAAIRTVAGSQPLTPKPSPAMACQMELVESLLAGELPIDADRLYVTGLSMGGYGTWDIISRKPEWFAAAMPVCGGGDPAQASRLKDLPIYIHHGDADGNVAVWNSRAMYAALIMAGSNNARYMEYPKCGHRSWEPAYGNLQNLDWLFAQRRPPTPVWQPAKVEKLTDGALKIASPGPRYEIAFMVGAAGQQPVRVVVRRTGRFPTVTVGGRVVERTVFTLNLTGNQVLLASPKDGPAFDFTEIRIRALDKGEK